MGSLFLHELDEKMEQKDGTLLDMYISIADFTRSWFWTFR